DGGGAPAPRLAPRREGLRGPPGVRGTRGDRRVREHAADGGVVVDDLERAEADLAHVQRGDRSLTAALAATEALHVAHATTLLLFASRVRRSAHVGQRGFWTRGTVRQQPERASMVSS